MSARPSIHPRPLVSVLIPAFNHEAFIGRCLDSVLEDPYPAKELVIIDDASSDATPERIAAWVARHQGELPIEYVRHQGNRGIAATLNELAARAHGPFLRPGASDDYLLPGGLDAQVGYLQRHPHKGAVVSDSIVVDHAGKTLHGSGMRGLHGADKRLYASDDGIRRAVINHWSVSGPVTLIRTRALHAISGWREGLRVEDWDLFLRLAAHDALGFIDARVCAYRLHGGNVSKCRDVGTRIGNLAESRNIALGRLALFDEPYRTLLRAQSHYIAAKIAFLERRLGPVGWELAMYAALMGKARFRMPTGQAHEGRA